MKRLKVVVTGAFNCGKTQFIKSISEIEVISTEKKNTVPEFAAIKEETTVAMDFGKVTKGGDKVFIFGTPGQQRFDFMWEALSENMLGFIVLVDSCDPERFDEAKQIIKFFSDILEEPYVVAANKQDKEGAISSEDLRKELNLDKDEIVLPCNALDKKSAEAVLDALFKNI